jgi:hypothetical protein
MAVIIGSARHDERGKARGGKAGDNTRHEVETQSWYNRITNPWKVIRCKDLAKRALIAKAMRAACANNNIGYDQGQRDTLYSAARAVGYDPGKVTKPVETDCSALVRVCCAYAGILASNFTTPTEESHLMATGEFEVLRASKYAHKPDYLMEGDILCTTRQGHTVVVLSNGSKAREAAPGPVALGSRMLERGDRGDDVGVLQSGLKALRFDPKGIDKDFGPNTERAVKAFQKAQKIEVDGVVGPITVGKLRDALKAVVKS